MLNDSDINELYHERAAVFEFDAKIPREEAEVMAYFEIKRNNKRVTEEIKSVYKAAQGVHLNRRNA
jgi:hypothetical protein